MRCFDEIFVISTLYSVKKPDKIAATQIHFVKSINSEII